MHLPTTLLGIGLALPAGISHAEVLLPGDQLELRIVEWVGVEGVMQEWTAMKGPFVIAPNGKLHVAFAGDFDAGGRDSDDLATEIGARLRDTLALTGQLEMSLSIAARSPVILGGLTRKPGAIDYLPGMTVRHAVALAGGLGAPSSDVAQTDSLYATSEIARLTRLEGDLLLRIARLKAERSGEATADFPLPATLGEDAAARIEAETAILDLRLQAAGRKADLIDRSIALFSAEIVALEEKIKGLEKQGNLVRQERDKIEGLVEKGLAQSARLLDFETRLAAVESQSLDVATALLRARQSLSNAESERIQLDETRVTEVLAALQKAETELADVRTRLDLQRSLHALAGPASSGALGTEPAGVRVTIVAANGTGPVTAGWDTPLSPGDLVEISLAPVSEDLVRLGEGG